MKPHVLILEDNFIISHDMASLVAEQLHATPVLSRSVAAALKLIPEAIAFAFLDIDVIDGVSFPVAHKLSANEIPFVFLSGKTKNQLPEAFSQAPFLSKPVDGDRLMQLTRSLSSAFE
jgi:two-component SAPR family response regulator